MTTSIAAEPPIARNGVAAVWGAAGVVGICLFAIWRLTPITVAAFEFRFTVLQWALLVANVLFMAWSEGYRGFQQKFAPRTAARVLYLYRTPVPVWVQVLAPLFCFGYFYATRRAMLIAWCGTLGIILLVVVVNQLAQPWRGIIDAGVVIGLSWGTLALLAMYYKAMTTGEYPASPETTH